MGSERTAKLLWAQGVLASQGVPLTVDELADPEATADRLIAAAEAIATAADTAAVRSARTTG